MDSHKSAQNDARFPPLPSESPTGRIIEPDHTPHASIPFFRLQAFEMNFQCAFCGGKHEFENVVWHCREPLPWLRASEAERARSAITEDQCQLVTPEGTHFFVRALLSIPIKGGDKVFTWGVWCSLSEKSYAEVSGLGENPDRRGMRPYVGWLCSSIPGYPDTLYLKTLVHQREVGLRPTVELEPSLHPLAVHQREGIDPAELHRRVSTLCHGQEKQNGVQPAVAANAGSDRVPGVAWSASSTRPLAFVAFVMYVIAHFLPALGVYRGLVCHCISWSILLTSPVREFYTALFALDNLLFVVLLVRVFGQLRFRLWMVVLSGLSLFHVLSWWVRGQPYFLPNGARAGIGIGYYIWAAAFVLVFLVTLRRWRQDRSLVPEKTRARRTSIREKWQPDPVSPA